MKLVALLRGINVGGKNRVEMARLRTLFESLGCRDVRSYINSGNVLFDDVRAPDTLRTLIEDAIATEFGFPVPTVLRDEGSLVAVADAIPSSWRDDATMRCYVMFLWEDVDTPAVLDQLTIQQQIDDVSYVPGAIIWRADRDQLPRSGMMKLQRMPLYQQITIRNCNTVRKLASMFRAS